MAYIVLAISTVFDLVSFRQSAGQIVGSGMKREPDAIYRVDIVPIGGAQAAR